MKKKKALRLIHFFSFTPPSLGAKYETGLNWLFMLLGLTYYIPSGNTTSLNFEQKASALLLFQRVNSLVMPVRRCAGFAAGQGMVFDLSVLNIVYNFVRVSQRPT